MRQLAIFFLLLCSLPFFAQSEDEPMLLGKIQKADLLKAPYNEWFDKEYNAYEPDAEIINELKKKELWSYTFTIFLGTWCADSHREVPRFVKVLECMGVSPEKIQYIALNTGDNVHKQSPTGEERGKYIFRVPTFIISTSGTEVSRIVEYPVVSLESDLFQIIASHNAALPLQYSPSYRSYSYIIDWIENGLLTNKNISLRGLADQIRYVSKSAGEINSAAFVLSEQGQTQEAVALCKIAAILYPDTANYYSYAYILWRNGQNEEALAMLKKYMVKATNTQNIDWGLELYDKIKNKQK